VLKKIFNRIKTNLLYFVIFSLLTSCATAPKNTQDACSIFSERYFWYKYAKKSSEEYDVPIHIILAFVKKESDFRKWARPARTKLFKIIPYKRPSSSLGYSQAVKKTWELYKKDTNNKFALRTRFKDSVMFVGWFINKTHQVNKIPLNDPYRQYLNYYLGWGSYAKKNYKTHKDAIIFAKAVKKQSNVYRKQLKSCKENLDRKKYIIF
jgi:hypothetical protein|tara:strand:+ start:94 stop:717 length:624 start_codon:yes stop_codon:yes gene_type:complete